MVGCSRPKRGADEEGEVWEVRSAPAGGRVPERPCSAGGRRGLGTPRAGWRRRVAGAERPGQEVMRRRRGRGRESGSAGGVAAERACGAIGRARPWEQAASSGACGRVPCGQIGDGGSQARRGGWNSC
ncbi:hypothetical protein PVAP13_1NG242419 [Panicum virgatum]|uniref:Uncharacterized protein n=1 Tax=Panicum virgatum TaxID=38727 RepID=A0A8T0WVI3_PANVG|nr:hypothetical protein PVAP13_1NG242419 [Panicum virgatum]